MNVVLNFEGFYSTVLPFKCYCCDYISLFHTLKLDLQIGQVFSFFLLNGKQVVYLFQFFEFLIKFLCTKHC